MNSKHVSLIKHLALREIKARYKQSFLGLFWVLLNPLFQILILSFVFSNIMKVRNLGVPYPVFLYAGLLPWLFFANSLSSSMSAFLDNSSLIRKIYFPREILILSTILAKAFDFFLASIIFILMLFYFKIPISIFWLFFLPIFLVQFIFIYGLAILLSSLNLFYRDVQFLFNLVLTLWFYLTPIIYSVELFPARYRFIFQLNPMSIFINAYRQVLLAKNWPNFSSLFLGAVVSISLFFISYKIFKKLEGTFADVI